MQAKNTKAQVDQQRLSAYWAQAIFTGRSSPNSVSCALLYHSLPSLPCERLPILWHNDAMLKTAVAVIAGFVATGGVAVGLDAGFEHLFPDQYA